MAELTQRLRGRGRLAVRSIARAREALRSDELDVLRSRVEELEDEIQECRQLNLRLAELTDLVQELLLPVAARDEEKVAELMERYSKSL